MTVVKGSQKMFIPAPEGLYQAVCVDEVLMAQQETQWGPKDKLRVTWQLEERVLLPSFIEFFGREPNEEEWKNVVGKRYTISQFYTATLGSANKPSNLRKLLQAWRGSKVTQQEDKDGFDFERMVGANAMIQVIHNEPEPGKIYANVAGVMPIQKSMTKLVPEDYIRAKDRDQKHQPSDIAHMNVITHASEDDIPF